MNKEHKDWHTYLHKQYDEIIKLRMTLMDKHVNVNKILNELYESLNRVSDNFESVDNLCSVRVKDEKILIETIHELIEIDKGLILLLRSITGAWK